MIRYVLRRNVDGLFKRKRRWQIFWVEHAEDATWYVHKGYMTPRRPGYDVITIDVTVKEVTT